MRAPQAFLSAAPHIARSSPLYMTNENVKMMKHLVPFTCSVLVAAHPAQLRLITTGERSGT
ncbi:hypothetical protein EYF80_060266 [Liparis tanakae]|uniref:Uncharacterized protein n=1 Tax=Liparis tanakae TaxID=230148 RepID=A0A4Z2EL22_9TELE|nr:hypothetical protein EYF80_060266 [Liparis tanakae]